MKGRQRSKGKADKRKSKKGGRKIKLRGRLKREK